jgi:hypothetical protein
MRKALALLIPLCLVSVCWADEESWLGLFMQGNKIGYAHSRLSDTELNKVPAKKSESSTVMNAGLLGQAMSVRIDSTSWIDASGHPILMKFNVESAGRTEKLDALFTSSDIRLSIDNSGAKTSKTIPLPKDAGVVDDAVSALLEKGYRVGAQAYYYVLDPMTASLVKNRVTFQGKGQVQVNGKEVTANKIEIYEPRATMYAFVTEKGDLVKVDGPMGIEMFPMSRTEALKESGARDVNATDLAFSTSLRPDKPIADVGGVKELQLRITGHDLAALPSDAHQTLSKTASGWLVNIHPMRFGESSGSIASSAKEKPEWTKASFNIPSDLGVFSDLAKKLVSGTSSVQGAAKRIQAYVHTTMTPNAGIGVLRDASEILKTKEGVCRDYAVLTATLLRAVHVPSRLVSGLVYEEGSFYYHAWVEVWDGANWVGVDSTLPSGQVTAGHIKLAQGNVEDAFTFTFLDKVKVEVLNARRA